MQSVLNKKLSCLLKGGLAFLMGKGGGKMRKALIATGVILLVLVVTNLQSIAEENIIYSCVDKSGKFRKVNAPNDCKESETAIYWNKVGPQGEPGQPGEQGPEGQQGPQGDQGPKGDKGDTGATGPQGDQGLQGDTGATGSQGPQGDTGPEGPQGIAGLDGTDGLHCWDLNGNYACDLPDEDKNDDDECDVSDCQGPPDIGYKGIYDGNGIFLGYCLNDFGLPFAMESKILPSFFTATVFNPDIPGYYIVKQQLEPSPHISFEIKVEPAYPAGYFYRLSFQSGDCSGQPYIQSPSTHEPFIDGVFEHLGQYYIIDYELAPIVRGWDIHSYIDDGTGVPCGAIGAPTDEQPKTPVRQVYFPFAVGSLEYPLELRTVE
jgi:hypothetical protein